MGRSKKINIEDPLIEELEGEEIEDIEIPEDEKTTATITTKTKSLTADQYDLLKSIVDHESTLPIFDEKIIKEVKSLNIEKELIIEFLIKYIRDLERNNY